MARPSRIDRVDEGARLDARRGDGAGAEKLELQPVQQHPPADALLVIAVAAVGNGDDRHLRMVDEVLADARQIGMAGDAVRLQLIGGADAGQHQKLRRHQRARGDDDLAPGKSRALGAVLVAVGDAFGNAVLDVDPAARGHRVRAVKLLRPSSGSMKA